MVQQSFKVKGLHCGACVQRVQGAIASIPGVEEVNVSLSPPALQFETGSPIPTTELNTFLAKVGDYSLEEKKEVIPSTEKKSESVEEKQEISLSTFKPLLLVLGYILGVVLLVALTTSNWNLMSLMRYYMAGFFIAFSFFKMLDVRGFANSFSMYDPIAKRAPIYGYIYPFIELGLGALFLTGIQPIFTNVLTLIIIGIGTIGVVSSVLDKREIKCACLGTGFNLPMTTVTIIENSMMLVMATCMLIYLL